MAYLVPCTKFASSFSDAALLLGGVGTEARLRHCPAHVLGSRAAALGAASSVPVLGGKFAAGVFVGHHGSCNWDKPVERLTLSDPGVLRRS